MSDLTFAPFSNVALRAINDMVSRIVLLHGAVRSGKTFASIVAWLQFLANSPHKKFLMSGQSTDSLYRNVIDGEYGILAIMGKRAQYNASAKGGPQLILKFGRRTVTCYCRGASDAGSEAAIRGSTLGGWYADEITLHHKNFALRALDRLSLAGARAFWTTNPDNPQHWVMQEYILKAKERRLRAYHFRLDDNLSLSEQVKADLRSSYSGIWAKRFLDGLWIQAAGSIYDMLDASTHLVDKLPKIVRWYAGADVGTGNATVMVLGGVGEDDCLYVAREWVHDSRQQGYQLTNQQMVARLKAWFAELDIAPDYVYVDPAAADFKLTLWREGVDGVREVRNATNDVIPGIRAVSSLLGAHRLKFLKVHTKYSWGQMQGYAWDEKAQQKGEDRPVKIDDHACDAIRYMVMGCRNVWTEWLKEAA